MGDHGFQWGPSLHQGYTIKKPDSMVISDTSSIFSKGGTLPGYHSEFALIPGSSYGIIVLLTGSFADARDIVLETVKNMQPVFAKTLETQLKRKYVGTWINGADIAEVKLVDGYLYLNKLVTRGVDVLRFVQNENKLVEQAVPVALWTTGRLGEFR